MSEKKYDNFLIRETYYPRFKKEYNLLVLDYERVTQSIGTNGRLE